MNGFLDDAACALPQNFIGNEVGNLDFNTAAS